MTMDRALTIIVQALYLVLILSVCGAVYLHASAPTYRDPTAVRGSLLGPGR